MTKNKNKIAVLTAIPFPYGMAGTNRIISYSKGLVELGNNVTVMTTSFGVTKSSYFSGIEYKSFRKKYSNAILNKILLPFSVIRMVMCLFRTYKNFDSVILVSNSAILIVLTFFICKFRHLKFIQEKSEFPFVLNNVSFLGKIYSSFYINYIYKLFDGMIIMTYPLLTYFEDKTKASCRKIVVPMTVEPERFEGQPEIVEFANSIAYCGHMGGNKDGVKNLISSFSLIESKFPDHELLLIGSASNEEMNELKGLSKQLGMKNIRFYGQVDRDTMPKILTNAKVLVLARPSSLQSTGGFPTKLGEYLSTGKPVVVTRVGDIPRYLSDKINAFLVKADDNEAFATTIEYVLNNYEEALKVGEEGKKLTKDIFNYRVQAQRINDFLIGFK